MLSIPDMALLGAAALMFFGPEQLPKVARKAGMLIRDVQNTSQSFIREMERAADDGSFSNNLSRAHLIEDPLSPVTTPPAYQPYIPEPTEAEPYVAESFNGHAYVPPEPEPPLLDVMPPRTAGHAGDRDLPP
jgi:Sec-independent protein translocase protein TatA